MRLSPIEEFRTRLNQLAQVRGMLSPSTQRISRMLDRLLTEWYQAVPEPVLASLALQPLELSRSELGRRYHEAHTRGDSPAMASLLPQVLQLSKDDPDRPQMLNGCGVHILRISKQRVPQILLVALEEAAATAPQWSLSQLNALGNLAAAYMKTGRFHAAYFVLRRLCRNMSAFPEHEPYKASIYYELFIAARWLGKQRLASHALRSATACARPSMQAALTTAHFSQAVAEIPLAELKARFVRIYPHSPFQAHLLGSYAGALLRHGFPRAAVAVANLALNRVQSEHDVYTLTHMELLIILAAASHRLGNRAGANAFLRRAKQVLGAADLTRPATVRMQDWLVLAGSVQAHAVSHHPVGE